MIVSVRPASPHTGAGLRFLLARCLAKQPPCGTTTKVSRLFNCASPRGQSSSSAARIVSKASRPARWDLPRDKIRGSESKRITRHLVTDATRSAKPSDDAAATPTDSGNNGNAVSSKQRRLVDEEDALATAHRNRRQLERVIQYTFEDDAYYRALVCTGHLKLDENVIIRAARTQLAHIGHAMLKAIWFSEQFPFSDPRTAKTRWKVVASNAAQASEARRLSLTESLGPIADDIPVPDIGNRALGNLVGAIIGAVFLDSGYNSIATKDVVQRLGLLDRMLTKESEVRKRIRPIPPAAVPTPVVVPAVEASTVDRLGISRQPSVAADRPRTGVAAGSVYAQYHV